jgi:hypothetical protein
MTGRHIVVWQHRGTGVVDRFAPNAEPVVCKHEECERQPYERGLCKYHHDLLEYRMARFSP